MCDVAAAPALLSLEVLTAQPVRTMLIAVVGVSGLVGYRRSREAFAREGASPPHRISDRHLLLGMLVGWLAGLEIFFALIPSYEALWNQWRARLASEVAAACLSAQQSVTLRHQADLNSLGPFDAVAGVGLVLLVLGTLCLLVGLARVRRQST